MIRNLLFDLGGVIMDIKRDNCVAAFKRLGMEHPEQMLDAYTQRGPFLGIEDGTYSPEEFRAEIRKYIPSAVSDKEIDDAFSDFLVGIPVMRLHQLEQLRERFRVYMISNTNPIMWNGRIAAEFRKDGKQLDNYFDGVITSFEAKSVKPDTKIFLDAIKKFDIEPAETLFFDDSERNVEAARALGFNAVVVEPGTEFFTLVS